MVNTLLHEHVGIRLKPEDKELLQRVCEDRGEDISTFVRRLIRMELARLSFYPEDVKKALGLQTPSMWVTQEEFQTLKDGYQ